MGDGGVAKTSFVDRLLTGRWGGGTNLPTMGMEVHHVLLHTNKGPIVFNISDFSGISGDGRNYQWYEKLYAGADAAIIMLDVRIRFTYKRAKHWHEDIKVGVPGVTAVLVGNKCDGRFRKVFPRDVIYRWPGVKYFEISVKTGDQVEMPLLHLARQLTGSDDLEAVDPISGIVALVNHYRGQRPRP